MQVGTAGATMVTVFPVAAAVGVAGLSVWRSLLPPVLLGGLAGVMYPVFYSVGFRGGRLQRARSVSVASLLGFCSQGVSRV